MPYIYVITNDVNEKQYVGKTLETIDKRFKQHIRDRNRDEYRNRPLYRAMNKYGVDHFTVSE